MKSKWKALTRQQLFLPIFSLIVVLLINLVKDPGFFQIGLQNGVLYGRLIDILNRGSEIAILAVGQTLVVAVSAGTDISVGSVMSLTACGTCMMLAGYGNNSVTELAVPMGVGICFGLLLAFLCGCMNGALVAKLKIQPMVATLILFSAGRAIGLLLCNSSIVYINVESFKFFGGYCGIFPTPVLITAACVLVTALVLKFTALGTYVQAVGINKNAARISGYKSAAIIFLCYVLCGLFAGIAGITATSRIYSADTNNIGLNLEMDAILAVALGGNSLGGGKFRLSGSIIGAYTIQAITTTLYALGVSSAQAPVFKAIIVIAIVTIQSPVVKDYMKKRNAKRAAKEVSVA